MGLNALQGVIINVAGALVQLVLGLAFSLFSVYVGIKLFDKFTEGVDEWKEIKKGNVAVGIVLAVVILALATVVQGGVAGITASLMSVNFATLTNPFPLLIALGIGIMRLFLSLCAAVIAIFIAYRVLDKITTDIDEGKELAKGNVAVALIVAGVLLAVSLVINAAVAGLTTALDPVAIAAALGL